MTAADLPKVLSAVGTAFYEGEPVTGAARPPCRLAPAERRVKSGKKGKACLGDIFVYKVGAMLVLKIEFVRRVIY